VSPQQGTGVNFGSTIGHFSLLGNEPVEISIQGITGKATDLRTPHAITINEFRPVWRDQRRSKARENVRPPIRADLPQSNQRIHPCKSVFISGSNHSGHCSFRPCLVDGKDLSESVLSNHKIGEACLGFPEECNLRVTPRSRSAEVGDSALLSMTGRWNSIGT
jgi:hypothetical protein